MGKLKMIRNIHIASLVLIIGCISTSPVPEEDLRKKLISDEGGDYENVEVLLTAQGVSYPLPDGRKSRALVKPRAPVADGQVVAENKARALVDPIESDYDEDAQVEADAAYQKQKKARALVYAGPPVVDVADGQVGEDAAYNGRKARALTVPAASVADVIESCFSAPRAPAFSLQNPCCWTMRGCCNI